MWQLTKDMSEGNVTILMRQVGRMFFMWFVWCTLFFMMAKSVHAENYRFWNVQAIDTMKYSRDLARDTEAQKNMPDWVAKIADLGPTHIAIGTPYDEEFYPLLEAWVKESRKQGLKIWFRGNFSAWEGWFDRPKNLSAEEHHKLTAQFITKHPNLFEEGDIFTPAPEPENGALGDPREAKSKQEPFLAFITTSQATCEQSFKKINIAVTCGYFSTNGDVAKEVLTIDSVKNAGNVVVIDHYVKESKQLYEDILFLNKKYNALVGVGEFGAPIPDLHGQLDEADQAKRIREDLSRLAQARQYLVAINYWTAFDGTTQLFNADGSARQAVNAIKDYYKPGIVKGSLRDKGGKPIANASVKTIDGIFTTQTNEKGEYTLILPQDRHKLQIFAEKYGSQTKSISVYRGEKVNLDLEFSQPNRLSAFIIVIRNWITQFLP